MNPGEFPHSEISGSMLICSSPKLIAAYHVLHRYFRGIRLSGGISVYPYVLVSAADLLRGRSDADFPRHGHRRGRYPAGRYCVCDAVPGKQEAGSRKSLISIPKAGAAAPAFVRLSNNHCIAHVIASQCRDTGVAISRFFQTANENVCHCEEASGRRGPFQGFPPVTIRSPLPSPERRRCRSGG